MDPITLGGITGIFGSVFSHVADYFQNKENKKAEAAIAETQLKIAQLEVEKIKAAVEGNRLVAAEEGKAKIAVAEAEANMVTMKASIDADTITYLNKLNPQENIFIRLAFGLLDWLRGFIRIALTLGYTTLFAILVISVVSLLTKDILMTKYADEILSTAQYLAVSCGLWWFGISPIRKRN